jgi:hypothetical protein
MRPEATPWITDFVVALRSELALHLHARSFEVLRSAGVAGSGAVAREPGQRPSGPVYPAPQDEDEHTVTHGTARQAAVSSPIPVAPMASPRQHGAPATSSSTWPGSPRPAAAPAPTPVPRRVTGLIEVTPASRPGHDDQPWDTARRVQPTAVIEPLAPQHPGGVAHAAPATPDHATVIAPPRPWSARGEPRPAQTGPPAEWAPVMLAPVPMPVSPQASMPVSPQASVPVSSSGEAGPMSGYQAAVADVPGMLRRDGSSSVATPVGRIERVDVASPLPSSRPDPIQHPVIEAAPRGARIDEPWPDTSATAREAAASHAVETLAREREAAGLLVDNAVRAAGYQVPGYESTPEPGLGWDQPTAAWVAPARPLEPWPGTESRPTAGHAPAGPPRPVALAPALPSPWSVPAQTQYRPGVRPLVPALPPAARALQPPPAASNRSSEAMPVAHAHAGPGHVPAPWPEADMHDDAAEPARTGDDELAGNMLRILIAEARREGLEL